MEQPSTENNLDQLGFSIAIFDYQKTVIKPMDNGYGVSENGEL